MAQAHADGEEDQTMMIVFLTTTTLVHAKAHLWISGQACTWTKKDTESIGQHTRSPLKGLYIIFNRAHGFVCFGLFVFLKMFGFEKS